MTTFKEIGIDKEMLEIIESMGFKEPSEIQAKVIPLALQGKDIIGESATGSGKTLAFAAPVLHKVQRGKGIQALVLTPTRELAEQVKEEFRKFSRNRGIKVTAIYGGVSMNPQIYDLREADVVVGTPGRILDHLRQRTLDLRNIGFLVLDEADRMLDMGFINDVEDIISQCPKKRQTFLFSATISQDIHNLSKRYMNSPEHLEVENYVDASKLAQVFYDVRSDEKFSLLVHLLKDEKSNLVMVFCNTKR